MKALDLLEVWGETITANQAALLDVAIAATLLATGQREVTITPAVLARLTNEFTVQRNLASDGIWSISLVSRGTPDQASKPTTS